MVAIAIIHRISDIMIRGFTIRFMTGAFMVTFHSTAVIIPIMDIILITATMAITMADTLIIGIIGMDIGLEPTIMKDVMS